MHRSLIPLRAATVAVVALAALAAVLGGTERSSASFVQGSGANATRFTAAVDWGAPAVSRATVVVTSSGGPASASPGFLRPGATFRIYANVADQNSGVGTVRADLTAIAGSGAAATTLVASAATVGGLAYTHASAQLTVVSALADGTVSYRVTAADNASNAAAVPYTATIDGTAPRATDIQTANAAAGTNGIPEAGDTVTYSFSEPVAPASILAGWTGDATPVTLRIVNGSPNDNIQLWTADGATRLPVGGIDAGKKYVTSDVSFAGSTMTVAGSTVRIVLGTPVSTQGIPNTAAPGTASMTWTPGSGVTDRAGNPLPTTAVSETGTLDRDF